MEENEKLFEELNGLKKKSMSAALNKEHLSKYELDDIFVA